MNLCLSAATSASGPTIFTNRLDTLPINIVDAGDAANASNLIEPGSFRYEDRDLDEGASLPFEA